MTIQLITFLYSLVWMAITTLLALLVWQLTKHYYAREWLRFAPAKARDVVLQVRKDLLAVADKCRQLEAENAELRGRIEGAKLRLGKSRSLELVERRGA